MDDVSLFPTEQRSGLIYRLNAGYRFRIAGSDAQNDGIQADMDIGYQSKRFYRDKFSLETGSTLDLFGETEHLGAYLQLNYHHRDHWIFSVRAMGGGVNDDREAAAGEGDSDDLGGIFGVSWLGSYRLDENFIAGIRASYFGEAYGNAGGDQGTQHSLAGLLHLAYKF